MIPGRLVLSGIMSSIHGPTMAAVTTGTTLRTARQPTHRQRPLTVEDRSSEHAMRIKRTYYCCCHFWGSIEGEQVGSFSVLPYVDTPASNLFPVSAQLTGAVQHSCGLLAGGITLHELMLTVELEQFRFRHTTVDPRTSLSSITLTRTSMGSGSISEVCLFPLFTAVLLSLICSIRTRYSSSTATDQPHSLSMFMLLACSISSSADKSAQEGEYFLIKEQ